MATVLSPAPAPPPVSTGPTRHVWTVAEFHTVNSTGVWAGRRPVLLRGVVWEQGPMNPPHALGVELLVEALRAVFTVGWRVRMQLPLVLGLDTDPFPDVAVVPGSPRDFATRHPTTAALVVEVSDTTLALDLTVKAELYAASGIADYWVLDLNARTLHVLRDPRPVAAGGHSYRDVRVLGPADSVAPLAAPAGLVAVADLLP